MGGERFRTELAEALEEGFPIDYVPPSADTGTLLQSLMLGFPWYLAENPKRAEEEYYNTLRFMLNKNADVNIKDSDNYNVLMICVSLNTPGVFLPIDIFKDIVAKTEDLDHVGQKKSWGEGKQTAFQLLAEHYILSEIADQDLEDYLEDQAFRWEKLTVLIDAGADCDIDETYYVMTDSKNACKKLKAKTAKYKEIKLLQKTDNDVEYER